MKCKKFKGRRFSSVRDFHKKEGSSNGDRKKKRKKKDLVCFKCKKPMHFQYDCPLYKSEAKKGKKAMVVT